MRNTSVVAPPSTAARELYADLVTGLKGEVRQGRPILEVQLDRMVDLAAELGEGEHRLAVAVRSRIEALPADASPSARATVIVGLVELGERARRHL